MMKSALTVALVAGSAAGFASADEAMNNPQEADGRIPHNVARQIMTDRSRQFVYYINMSTGERYRLDAEQAASLFPAAGSFPGGPAVLHGDMDPCNVVAESDDPGTTATDESDVLDVGNYALFVADNPDGDGNGLSDLFGDDPVLGDGVSPPGDPRFFTSFFVNQSDQFVDCMFVQYFTNGVEDLDTDGDGTNDAVDGMDLTIAFYDGIVQSQGTLATQPFTVVLEDAPGSPGFGTGSPLDNIATIALILDFSDADPALSGFELGDTDGAGANGTGNFTANAGVDFNDVDVSTFEGVDYSVSSWSIDLTQGTNVAHAWGAILGWQYGDPNGFDLTDPADGVIDSWFHSKFLGDQVDPANTIVDAVPPSDRKPAGGFNSVFGIFDGPGTDLSDPNAVLDTGFFVVAGSALLCDDPATTGTDETAPGGDVVMELYAPFTPEPCAADIAAPMGGVLDFFDVLEYLSRFDAMDPSADLAAPAGVFDFFDVLAYLGLFDEGCDTGSPDVDSSPFTRFSDEFDFGL
ncbi:MAG: GC-type dockerin domain-anchored protein [Planctomycetota bacterium]